MAQGEFNIDKAKEPHAALDDLSKQMARQLSDFRGHICEMYRVWNCENSEIILTDCLTVHLDNIGPIETGTLDGFAEYALARSADNRASEERNTQTTAAMKSLFDYT